MAGKAQMILHAAEAGQGAPLVLLHGLFGSARNFATVQREFARQHRTIALDLRNHGASPHAPDMAYPAMAGDVLQTLDRLHALPATLLGHSMGGKVAMLAALTQPGRIARLIVADIAPVAYPPHYRDIAAAMASLSLPPGATRADADAALAASVPDKAMRAFLLQNMQTGASPAWRIGMAEIAAALPVIEDWDAPSGARYDGPTLFIAGATSNYIQPANRAAIRALFPQARFVTLKHAGHWLHADNPSGFIAVVEAFLTATT
jgi:esterase